MTLIYYWLIGMMLMIIAFMSMPNRPPLTGIHGFLATLLGCLLWPLVLVTLWYEQQKNTWHAGPVQIKSWLSAKETSGAYHFKKVTLIIRYSPRRLIRLRQLALLVRPRPSLQAPVLCSPNALHLNLLCCQVIIVRPLPS